MDVIIYHNPDCGTSRNTLAMIRNADIEPHVIEYLKTPPARALLQQLIGRMTISVRDLLREKGTPFGQNIKSAANSTPIFVPSGENVHCGPAPITSST